MGRPKIYDISHPEIVLGTVTRIARALEGVRNSASTASGWKSRMVRFSRVASPQPLRRHSRECANFWSDNELVARNPGSTTTNSFSSDFSEAEDFIKVSSDSVRNATTLAKKCLSPAPS